MARSFSIRVPRLAQLSARFIGTPVAGMNPGWRGHVGADVPFAALALVRAGTTAFWGKAEVSAPSGFPVMFHLHPLNDERTSVQFLFTLGSRMVGGASASLHPARLLPVQVSHAPAGAGRAFKLCAFESQPPCACFVFFLAASDVSVGRTGLWRPHKRFRGVYSPALELVLFGGRYGSYSRPGTAF